MIRQALLSLLDDSSKYGYQLKSEFEAATGSAWVLNIGQVYNTLGRMERDGVIIGLGSDSDGRVLYEISAAGRLELAQWLDEAVERSTSTRDEVAMKVLMAASTGVKHPGEVIAVQRDASMMLLQQATVARNAAASVADRLHLERLIVMTNAELRWLDIAEEALIEDVLAHQSSAVQPAAAVEVDAPVGMSSEEALGQPASASSDSKGDAGNAGT